MSFNLSTLLPPGTNFSAAIAQASKAIEQIFQSGPQQSAPLSHPPQSLQDTVSTYIASVTDFLTTRTALENTSILLALCTFGFLAMSWASRFGNMAGRFSPFTRSPPQGSAQVSDADFSYITADDLRQHNVGGANSSHRSQRVEESPVDYGPPRDTDCLILRNKKKEFVVHFPAYSIAKGELTIGQVREHAAKKAGTADPRRVKLLYKGKNLKDDMRTCRHEGLRHESELLCTIAESMPSASNSEEDDEDDDDFGDGVDGQTGADGEAKRRRNRGKKSKRRNKREAQQASGTSTPAEYANLQPPPAAASSQHSRAPSPKPPPTPVTPIDKLNALRNTLGTFLPQVDAFRSNPPTDPAKKEFEHKKLSETILAQVLLKLDAVETEGDPDARARRKELVRETQGVLNELDALVKR